MSSSGWGGCALWAVAFLVVIIGGCVVGLTLRPDPRADTKPTTVEAGDNWLLQVHRDETKAPCAELVDNKGKLLAGQCAYATKTTAGRSAYLATSVKVGSDIVVFGPVPDSVASVRLTLADGSHPQVRTGEKNGIHYFVNTSGAADVGPTELLDAKGRPVTPPA